MFIIIYEFNVKPGFEKQLETHWHIVTEAIHSSRGSKGSRLHQAKDGTYVAYAQWPSEQQYNTDIPLPSNVDESLRLMRESCSSISVLKEMTVCDDLLKS